MADLHNKILDEAPPGPNSSNFMQNLAKSDVDASFEVLVPPPQPRGNPGSVTADPGGRHQSNIFQIRQTR